MVDAPPREPAEPRGAACDGAPPGAIATLPDDRGLYKWWVLALLTLAYVISMIDRQLPFILAEAIKADLDLSDAQIGLLGGLLFAAFYSICGIPIARLADIHSRRTVLAGAVGFWCVMTAIGGFAANFVQLALSRVGVAIGEAGCTPVAHSLIADYFRANRRATAIAIFSVGGPIGSMLGLLLGGWISDVSSWRAALLWIGLPGLVLSALIMLTLHEPERGRLDEKPRREAPSAARLIDVFRLLWSKKSFRHMAMGCGLYAFGASAKVAFSPMFLMRVHQLSPSETGMMLGAVVGVSGIVGTLAGGTLGDLLGKRDRRWYMWLPGVALLVAAPCLAVAFLASDVTVALIALVPSYGLGILFIAPTFAMAQALVPAQMRATASAVLMALMFLIGNSFGPTIVGGLSDLMAPRAGELSLSYALALTALTNVWGFVHYLLAAVHLRADLESVK